MKVIRLKKRRTMRDKIQLFFDVAATPQTRLKIDLIDIQEMHWLTNGHLLIHDVWWAMF